MKKYVKPQVKIELFTLSESIAITCDMNAGWVVKGSSDFVNNCYAETLWPEYDEMKVFSGTNCNYHPVDDCYTIFSDTANITYASR